MSRQRLIEYHLPRLKDKRAEVRLDAIKELVLLDCFEILDDLKSMYETDPDEEVRKTAQQAGRTLFIKQKASNSSSSS